MQKRKPKKLKKIYLLYICIILILIYCIIQIYAVFQSEIGGTVNMVNGVWQIKVNNTDISNGVNKEFTVSTQHDVYTTTVSIVPKNAYLQITYHLSSSVQGSQQLFDNNPTSLGVLIHIYK